MRRRVAVLALVALASCTAALALAPSAKRAVAAKAEEKPAKLKKNQAWVAPDFAAHGVRSIAFAPVSSFDRNPEAEKYVQQMIEPGFAQLKYRFIGQAQTMDRVRRGEVVKALEALHASYLAGATLDTAQARVIAEQVGADALLFSHVSQWQRYVVDEQTRGQSFTQLGVDMALYSLKDGRPLWRGNFQEKGDGPYHDPNVAPPVDRDPGGNAVGRKAQLEPPSYPEVLEKLVGRAVKSLPPPPPSS
jgi:hypothetical protein